VRFFETLEGPAPRFQALRRILGHVSEVGPIGAGWRGFVHKRLRVRRVRQARF
jgi:hypothetical protein